jgi:hypothetical protein
MGILFSARGVLHVLHCRCIGIEYRHFKSMPGKMLLKQAVIHTCVRIFPDVNVWPVYTAPEGLFPRFLSFPEPGHPLNHGGMGVMPCCVERVRVEIGKIFRGELDKGRGQGSGEAGEFHGIAVRLPLMAT